MLIPLSPFSFLPFQIETEQRKKMDVNLTRIQGDFDAIKTENKALQAKLKG